MKIVTDVGTVRDSHIYKTSQHLVDTRNTKGLWETIAEVVKVWEAEKKAQYVSHLVDMADKKETRLNKYGANKEKTLRYLVDIPQDILAMIRILYTVEEVPFDKAFFRRFARKFPHYKVADTL